MTWLIHPLNHLARFKKVSMIYLLEMMSYNI